MIGDPRVESHDADPRIASRLSRLKPGTVLFGTVVRRGQTATLAIGALRVRLANSTAYPNGTRVRVHVKAQHGRVQLDLTPADQAAGSDRAIDDQQVGNVRAVLGRLALRRPPRETATAQRYAAELQRRGLAPPEGQTGAWAELLGALGILGDQPQHREQRRDTSGAATESGTAGIDEFRRATPNPNHPLQLFNALRGDGELHWIVVPVSAAVSTSSVDAVLRVGVKLPEQRPLRAVLDVQDGSWVAFFDLAGDDVELLAIETSASAPTLPQGLLVQGRNSAHTLNNNSEAAFAPEQQRRIDTYG